MSFTSSLSIVSNRSLIKDELNNTCCILLGKNFLSYCLTDAEGTTVYSIKHFHFQNNVIGKYDFDDILNDDVIKEANKIKIAIDTTKFTVVPNAYFSENHLASYFTNLQDILPEEILLSQQISSSMTSVYALKKATIDFLSSRLSNVKFYDASACLLQSYPSQILHEHLFTFFIFLKDDTCTLSLYKKEELQLNQPISQTGTMDIIYHIANAIKQCNIDVEKMSIQVHGETNQTEKLIGQLQRHYHHVRSASRIKSLNYPDNLFSYPSHYFFTLFSVVTCV